MKTHTHTGEVLADLLRAVGVQTLPGGADGLSREAGAGVAVDLEGRAVT